MYLTLEQTKNIFSGFFPDQPITIVKGASDYAKLEKALWDGENSLDNIFNFPNYSNVSILKCQFKHLYQDDSFAFIVVHFLLGIQHPFFSKEQIAKKIFYLCEK